MLGNNWKKKLPVPTGNNEEKRFAEMRASFFEPPPYLPLKGEAFSLGGLPILNCRQPAGGFLVA